MHVRLVANALSDRSSGDCVYFNVRSTNQFYNAAFPTEFVCQSSHYIIENSKSSNNIGLVWSKIYMSKKCQFEDVTITFLIPRIFFLLVKYIGEWERANLVITTGRIIYLFLSDAAAHTVINVVCDSN